MTDDKNPGIEHEHTNRLAGEKSPYLLQHAHNPVDWYPWGEEALARARAEDKPIFVSIGYSTCHWCHVMERESFEDPTIADYMNKYFVCIKVDREERPDLDNLYMMATQAMNNGQGGWPMSVFLTPDLKPFFTGTYFPPVDRYGRSGFITILERLKIAWETEREQVLQAADQVENFLQNAAASAVAAGDSAALAPPLLEQAYRSLGRSYDRQKGGFTGSPAQAPKFPTPHQLTFLLRYAHRTGEPEALAMTRKTLDAMAEGGIHDHLGGGFHRYSTDRDWLVPHFEKMLYDQAGLAMAYTDAWLVTREPAYAAVVRDVLDYVLTTLTDPSGGFYSAEDADSEGVEGKFYVWSTAEVLQVLGAERGARFIATYGMREEGNWEEGNIPHTTSLAPLLDEDLAADRAKLLKVRDARIRPHLDDKIVTAWNGFMIEAFARAGRALDEPRYVETAERAADFVLAELRQDGRLLRHYRDGASEVPGYLEDYAYLGRALLYLYETTLDVERLAQARQLAEGMIDLFSREDGGFDFAGHDAEKLLAPVIEVYDGAMPSGNSMAVTFLLRLGHLTADQELEQRGWQALVAFSGSMASAPSALLEMISGLDFALGPVTEVVLAGDGSSPTLRDMRAVLNEGYFPNTVLAHRPLGEAEREVALIPYLQAQGALDGRPTAYVCRDYACRLPVHDADALRRELKESAGPSR